MSKFDSILKEIKRLNSLLTSNKFMDAMTEEEFKDFNTAVESIKTAKEMLNDIECAIFARLYC